MHVPSIAVAVRSPALQLDDSERSRRCTVDACYDRDVRPSLTPALLVCCGVKTLRYQPSKASAPMITAVDHGRSRLPRPARGGAIAGSLADGFPVWVVEHDDGAVSVVSAVAPPRPKRGGNYRDDVAAQIETGHLPGSPAGGRVLDRGWNLQGQLQR